MVSLCLQCKFEDPESCQRMGNVGQERKKILRGLSYFCTQGEEIETMSEKICPVALTKINLRK